MYKREKDGEVINSIKLTYITLERVIYEIVLILLLLLILLIVR